MNLLGSGADAGEVRQFFDSAVSRSAFSIPEGAIVTPSCVSPSSEVRTFGVVETRPAACHC
jgi:hypothetical protein